MTEDGLPLYRDRKDFDATVDAAAGHLGISATAVEKDYWVAQVLRSLAGSHGDDFIFKGGTSLSKAYHLVERFSEDVDVLVLPAGRGRGATDKLMKQLSATAAAHVDGEARSVGGAESGRHRSFEISYPTTRPSTNLISTSVLLEMGIRGGIHPHETRPVGSLLGDQLAASGFPTDDFDDLRPVPMPVLHPVRTLLEKLVHVEGLATTLAEHSELAVPGRTGRHFYDIYQLLGSQLVTDRLADRVEFDTVVADITEVSARWFSGTGTPEGRPPAGFASCRAFQPDDEISRRFSSSYEATMDELHFGTDPLPRWDQICERVELASDVL